MWLDDQRRPTHACEPSLGLLREVAKPRITRPIAKSGNVAGFGVSAAGEPSSAFLIAAPCRNSIPSPSGRSTLSSKSTGRLADSDVTTLKIFVTSETRIGA